MKTFLVTTSIAGLTLTVLGAWNLKRSEAGLAYHKNPLAIHESAYGKLLAELSQNTVDHVWHLGIEQVNPSSHGHDHNDHEGHDHAAGEDCETCKKADDATALLENVTKGNAKSAKPLTQSDSHHGHSHAPGEECKTCEKAELALKLLDKAPDASPAYKSEDKHDHAHASHSTEAHDDHAHDDHDHVHPHEAHDHRPSISPTDAITRAKDFLVDLKAAGYERTNPHAVSEAHKVHIAAEIEQMLLRSYRMDPTNYGVYNAYFLFLTIHELRSTPAAVEHARKISQHTIARAQAEDTAPGPWLTAEMALLNLFLLDQQDWAKQGIDPPLEKLREYRDFSAYCKQNFAVLKERAIADGRWALISEDKVKEMDERQYFANKTFEQFDALIARHPREKSETGFPDLTPRLPVAVSDADDSNE